MADNNLFTVNLVTPERILLEGDASEVVLRSGEGDITVPVPVYLIEHPKGRALFDTGLHPDCQHDRCQ